MQIYVWSNFTKKTNSTKRPTNGTLIEGYYRNSDPISLLTPVIRIEAGTTTPTWNYCYIPDFKRYYYIAEWTHIEGVWIAQLSCDVLASYKDSIGNQDMYVLRSSAESDGRIIDSKYPTKVKRSIVTNEVRNVMVTSPSSPSIAIVDPNVFDKKFSQGSYIVGIIGANDTGVTYYSFTYSVFKSFIQALNDDTVWEGWDSVTTSIPKQYAKAIADPLQFISSVTWIPFEQRTLFPNGDIPRVSELELGYWNPFPNSCPLGIAQLDLYQDLIKCQMFFNIPKHPQIANRGKWLQASPYSQYTLVLHPFGEFEFSGADLIDKTTIEARWYFDYITCTGMLYLYAGDIFLGCKEATFGVPIQINQQTVNIRGAIEGAIKGVVGVGKAIAGAAKTVVGIATGAKALATPMSIEQMASRQAPSMPSLGLGDSVKSIASGAAQAVGGFADAYESVQPKVQSKGGVGTYLPFGSGVFPKLIGEFAEIVDEFNRDLGRPLCKVRKPKDIPGFIIAENGYIDTVGTAEETDKVAQYVCGGFFYE